MIVTFFAAARSRAARRSPRSISRRVARATDKGLPCIYARHLASVSQSWHFPSRYQASACAVNGARTARPRCAEPCRALLASSLKWVSGAAVVLDRDPTLLGERLDTGRAAEPAVTRVLHATEGGHGLIGDALIVDVNYPRPDVRDDIQGGIEVSGDDPAGQPVLRVIGHVDGGLSRVDRMDDRRRPEDLGAEDVHVGTHVGEH